MEFLIFLALLVPAFLLGALVYWIVKLLLKAPTSDKVIEKSKFTYEAFLYRGCANFYLKEFEQSIVDFSKSGEGEFEEYWKSIAEKLLVDKSCFDYYKDHELPQDINEGFEVMKYKTLIH